MGNCSKKSAAREAETQDTTILKEAEKEKEAEPEKPVIVADVDPETKALTQLKLIFDAIDSDANGSVSQAELSAALVKDTNIEQLMKDAKMNPDQSVWRNLDKNQDGRITWDEFKASLYEVATEIVKQESDLPAVELPADEKALMQLKKVFDSLDKNHDESVDKDELSAGLNKDEKLIQLIAEANFNTLGFVFEQLDANQDGKVTWEEFQAALRAAAKEEVKVYGDVQAVQLDADEEVTSSKWCGC